MIALNDARPRFMRSKKVGGAAATTGEPRNRCGAFQKKLSRCP